MKHALTVLAASLIAFSSFSQAQSNPLCGEKEQNIQREIDHAEQHGNQHRVNGLKKALSEVRDHCTDKKLIAEHQQKIREHKEKVAERQAELKEAREKGDSDKIAKREHKLAEAESELKALEKTPYSFN